MGKRYDEAIIQGLPSENSKDKESSMNVSKQVTKLPYINQKFEVPQVSFRDIEKLDQLKKMTIRELHDVDK